MPGLIWWALACSGGSPEMRAQRAAILAFRDGQDQLQTDPAAAQASFQRALTHQPNAPLLLAWEGMAMARQGQLEEAVLRMDELIAADPRFAEARYNRAAWLTRLGRIGEAGSELNVALQLGAARQREAMQDPDFTPYLAHPSFDFLPDDVLTVAVEAPKETVFWGSEVTLRFRVLGTGGRDVHIEPAFASGPIDLVSVRENEHESSDGLSRDVRYTFRVMGAGAVLLGPFEVRAGPWSTQVPIIAFDAEAPAGKTFPGGVLDFRTPSESRNRWNCTADCLQRPEAPAIRRTSTGFDVLTGSNTRVVADADRMIRYDFSEGGLPLWTVWTHVGATALGPATVRSGNDKPVTLTLP